MSTVAGEIAGERVATAASGRCAISEASVV
jgi:hypothetical protein